MILRIHLILFLSTTFICINFLLRVIDFMAMNSNSNSS